MLRHQRHVTSAVSGYVSQSAHYCATSQSRNRTTVGEITAITWIAVYFRIEISAMVLSTPPVPGPWVSPVKYVDQYLDGPATGAVNVMFGLHATGISGDMTAPTILQTPTQPTGPER